MDYEDRILNKARDLFFKNGLRSVTMDDIALKLGMSKKTIYQAYKNKKDIINTITEKFLLNHKLEYDVLISTSKNAVDELLKLMENINSVFERLSPRIIFDLQRYFPEAWQTFKEYKIGFLLSKITENLKRGIEEGLFRKDINVNIIARMRLEQIQIALDPMIFPPDNFTFKEIHGQILLQYLRGITTVKGNKLMNKYMDIIED